MSAIEKSAEMMAPMRDKGKGRRIVFFGAATFRSQSGVASAPLTKLVRALAQRAATGMASEWGTSKYCPLRECKTELVAVWDGGDNRTRHCPNERCPLHTTRFDRDRGGARGIVGNAFDLIAGVSARGKRLTDDDFDTIIVVGDDDNCSTDVDDAADEMPLLQ